MTATLGRVIRERRTALGLTQEELAERVGDGVRQAEISRLEHDKVSLPRRPRLEQLAKALDLQVGHLLASSGWTGAEHLDDVEHNPETDSSWPEPASPVQATPPTGLGRVSPDVPGLQDALAKSEDLMLRSMTTMNRARVTMDLAEESARHRRSGSRQRDAALTGDV